MLEKNVSEMQDLGKSYINFCASLTVVLLKPICLAFENSVDPDQLASEEAN